MNLPKKDGAEYSLIVFVIGTASLIVQMIGASWLYTEVTGNEGLFLVPGFFSYVAAVWFAIGLYVLVHDLVIYYAFMNRKGMNDKLILTKQMNELYASLLLWNGMVIMILCVPAGLYRAKKGL